MSQTGEDLELDTAARLIGQMIRRAPVNANFYQFDIRVMFKIPEYPLLVIMPRPKSDRNGLVPSIQCKVSYKDS